MTNGRDEIDTWLGREVSPLMPPPGTLERIRHTARRRKRTQATLAVAGCAVIIAAAAVVPQLTGSPGSSGRVPPIAGGREGTSYAPHSAGPSASGGATPQSSTATPVQTGQHTLLSTTTSGTKPPPHFRPTSVTFAPTGTGVVGAVIGQAGPPCATSYCTSLAGTPDYGASWYGVSAPLTGGPAGNTGVSQLRFVNMRDGWAFGPALWETSGGGWPWHQEDTYGMRVLALEAATPPLGSARAFAVFASCNGTGQDYAAGCHRFGLYSSVAGSSTWTAVSVPAAFRSMRSAAPTTAALVIYHGTGYLLTPSGAVLRGPVMGGAWTQAGQAPCSPGPAQASGLPGGAQLVAGPALVLACDAAGTATIYTSADGTSWRRTGSVNTAGQATTIASAAPGQAVLASTAGLYYSADSGASWRTAAIASPPRGGFSYVGMTNATNGVAIPANAALGEVFVTIDGGRTWTASRIA